MKKRALTIFVSKEKIIKNKARLSKYDIAHKTLNLWENVHLFLIAEREGNYYHEFYYRSNPINEKEKEKFIKDGFIIIQ